jgi:uncharacterized protein (TIGR02594 family)
MKGIEVAKQHIGEQEDSSDLRSFLVSHARNGDIDIDPTNIAWCAAFMNACERSVGNPGNGRLNARSFLTYGHEVDQSDAEEGDICVFDFEHDGTHGHVTYLLGLDEDAGSITCLGGNQSDQVKYSTYRLSSLVQIRRF